MHLSKCGCCSGSGWSLLVLRLALGAVFIAHALAKLSNMDGTVAFFGSLGLAPFFAYLVSWLELLSGVLVIIGFWTCLAAGVLAVIMVFAVFMVKFKMGFLGGWELELMLFAGALAIVCGGTGKFGLGCFCPMCQKNCCDKPSDTPPAPLN